VHVRDWVPQLPQPRMSVSLGVHTPSPMHVPQAPQWQSLSHERICMPQSPQPRVSVVPTTHSQQRLPMHVSPDVHESPQLPQLESVPSSISQPFRSRPSQSSQVPVQLVMRQVRVEQDSLACARLHVDPQLPQSLSVSSGVSQPLLWLPSQSPPPASQLVMRQERVEQDSLACERLQRLPQLPQSLRVSRGVSQPFPSRPSQ